MSRYTPDAILDLMLDEFMLADEQAVCSSQPLTYFNACWPSMWVAGAVYDAEDLVRPPTDNGFIYECTVGGTAGGTEPAWGTVQDATFSSGGATFKAHANFTLINSEIEVGDKVKGDGPVDGRALTIAQKMGALVHTDGTVSHTALIDNSNRLLKFVTVSETSLDGDNNVTSGRTTLLHEVKIIVRDPSASV